MNSRELFLASEYQKKKKKKKKKPSSAVSICEKNVFENFTFEMRPPIEKYPDFNESPLSTSNLFSVANNKYPSKSTAALEIIRDDLTYYERGRIFFLFFFFFNFDG